MIDVTIDSSAWDNLADSFENFDADELAQRAAENIREAWIDVATERLNTSRAQYIAGIGDVTATAPNTRIIPLRGKLADMVEVGAAGFDMKASAERGRRVHFTSGAMAGKFRSIAAAGPGETQSRGDAWWHPGIEARNLRLVAVQRARTELSELVEDVMMEKLRNKFNSSRR